MIAALIVFTAAYSTVMLLGLQSKLMRDNNWKMSFFTSWLITLAQTASTYAVAHSVLPIEWYIFWAGLGGSLGIVSAHFMYEWYDRRNK
ncbi:holin [Pseudomonas phage vB_PpuP-Villemi]